LSNPLAFDACAYAAVLLLFGVVFYLYWDFWDDQAAQAYMAWGLFHGMRPYVDLVDPNWPGILLPHALAFLIAGTNSWALRALDLIFLYAMLLATSSVLIAWGVPAALRILAGCCYLTTYFATGWMWTAQRESFCWPLFVIGAIPFLRLMGPRGMNSNKEPALPRAGVWFRYGIASGLGIWIKPAPLLTVIVLIGTTALLADRADRRVVLRGILFYTLGIIAVSIAFVVALAAMGELSGFVKWGVFYDFGPYAQVKFSWPVRLHMMYEFLTDPGLLQLSPRLCIFGGLLAALWPSASRRWPHPSRPIIVCLALIATGALTVLLQGKPGSLYHFIPLEWALATFAAVVWSVVPWSAQMRASFLVTSVVMVALALHKEPHNPGTTPGSIAGKQLNRILGEDDQIVEWGYSPSLLLQAQRRTPFMTFIGTAFLITTPPDSWAAREVLDRLNVALRNPAVRYLLVERQQNYKIQPSTPQWPKDYLTADRAITDTLRTQYQELPGDTLCDFHTFIHNSYPHEQRPIPSPQ
jgi:hypothetical protein